MADFDLAVVGGGINGAGIARDAAGRGLRVLLVEQNDFASGTSSASTKLIHGGLRYLEHGALRLVRDALVEREVLLRMAPHLVRPLRFVLPYHEGLRPAWQLRAGLFLYDRLGGRELLPGTARLDLSHHVVGEPLKRDYRTAFEYSDCWVDDARLVVLNVVDAAERGASVRSRTRLVRSDREEGRWRLVLTARGQREIVTARALVNATGPWVAETAEHILRQSTTVGVRLVKGSHVVVRRLFDHDRAYIFQNADGRVLFAIPYERDFTLIGTTDVEFVGDPSAAVASAAEMTYLCRAASVYFRQPVEPGAVVHAFAGVRPLIDDGARRAEDLTRDYLLSLDAGPGRPALLTVYGGKITTYRRLAEAALAQLARLINMGPPWTARVPLPGGDIPWDGVDALVARAWGRWPFLARAQARRLVTAYGTRLDQILGDARSFADLGARFGEELTAAEVRHLMRHEFAQTAEDVLSRRTRLGLRLDRAAVAALADFVERNAAQATAAE
ncbi:MAG: glycerol-3-phosphate dehydrogenase [Xanthobacteraceae bacterium]|nr:glycerol-3-phosphate dehydrogenase [Xanthobacteraceae bacterium]